MSAREANGTETCGDCHLPILKGEQIVWVNDETVHLECEGPALAVLLADDGGTAA